ncbi:MAG: ECF transporter S component [Spirochaetia bacterium]
MNSKQIIIISFAGLVLNILGNEINTIFRLPLFLDTIGTIFVATLLGPWFGALIGFLASLLVGVIDNPVTIPFGLVNAVIGLITGFAVLQWGYKRIWVPLVLTVILAIVAPIIGTVIAVYLFGGATGGGIDQFFFILRQSGNEIFSSAFLVRVPANFFDKLLSCLLVFTAVYFLPQKWKGNAQKEGK